MRLATDKDAEFLAELFERHKATFFEGETDIPEFIGAALKSCAVYVCDDGCVVCQPFSEDTWWVHPCFDRNATKRFKEIEFGKHQIAFAPPGKVANFFRKVGFTHAGAIPGKEIFWR